MRIEAVQGLCIIFAAILTILGIRYRHERPPYIAKNVKLLPKENVKQSEIALPRNSRYIPMPKKGHFSPPQMPSKSQIP